MAKDATQLAKEGFRLIQQSNNSELWQKGSINVRLKTNRRSESDNNVLVARALRRAKNEEEAVNSAKAYKELSDKGAKIKAICPICEKETSDAPSMMIHFAAVHPTVKVPNAVWRAAGALPEIKLQAVVGAPPVEEKNEVEKKPRLFIDSGTRDRMKRIICDMTRAGKDRSEIADELARQGIRRPSGERLLPSDVGGYLESINRARIAQGLPSLKEEMQVTPLAPAVKIAALPASVQLMLDDPGMNDAKKLEVIRLFVKLPPSIELVLSDPDVPTAKKMEVLALFGK